jgi:crotonobetainyl-CoA:carnitine CoA-transferase CaiB-like acyl-CoA transferase
MPPLPTTGPLSGVRILDLTWVLSGPFCTATLADLGADVIKLERPPYGDVSRTTGPIINGESGYFFSINRGKRSIALDLSSEEGKALFLDLVKQVDVVVENFTPGKMDALGLGYAALSEANPALIYAAISGYGQTGPLREKPGDVRDRLPGRAAGTAGAVARGHRGRPLLRRRHPRRAP